jgi:hypothetical protein
MKIKFKLAGCLGLFLLLAWSIQSVDAATQLKKLGKSPFYKTKGLKAEAVFPLVSRLKGDVKLGFVKAGAAELYEPFMKQLKTAKPEPVTIQPGEALLWMMHKKKGKTAVLKDVVWAGKSPFQAYRVVVRQNERDHIFVIPLVCLNISLKEVTEVPKAMAPPPSPPKEEPKTAAPPIETVGAPPVAAVPPPAPASPPTPEAVGAPPVAVVPPPAPASPPTPEATEPEKPKAEAKKGFIVADVGVLMRFDTSAYGLLRLGYRYKFTDQFALTGLLGFAPLIDGDNADNPAFLADAIFTYHPAKMIYLGAGAGLWSTSKDSKGDLILEVGFPITGDPKGPKFEWFFEGRNAFDQFNDWTKYGRVGGGLRILF